jgi:hypothetical protein
LPTLCGPRRRGRSGSWTAPCWQASARELRNEVPRPSNRRVGRGRPPAPALPPHHRDDVGVLLPACDQETDVFDWNQASYGYTRLTMENVGPCAQEH